MAEEELARWNSALTPNRLDHPHETAHDPEDEYVVERVEEQSRAWVVYFATRRWVRTRNWRDEAVGALPFIVAKDSGELHRYGSGPEGWKQFTSWLDDAHPLKPERGEERT